MTIPKGMNRRHFMSHMAGASAMTIPALTFGNAIRANAQELKKKRKSAIMLWMSGGPSTMDLWDLKPGANTGGPFQQIATSGNSHTRDLRIATRLTDYGRDRRLPPHRLID